MFSDIRIYFKMNLILIFVIYNSVERSVLFSKSPEFSHRQMKTTTLKIRANWAFRACLKNLLTCPLPLTQLGAPSLLSLVYSELKFKK